MIQKLQEEKYTIDSHYKALKVANECLIKQFNSAGKDLQ